MDKGFDRVISVTVYVVALAMVAYHMLSAYGILLGSIEHQTVHLAFIFGLTFLVVVRSAASPIKRLVYLGFLACGLLVTAYVYINLDTLEQNVGFPTPTDIAVGILMIVLAFEGTRQAWGWILPIVAFVFVAYFLFGHYLGGPLYHRQFSLGFVISYLSIGFSGIYGTFLSISANQIFLFVVFGSMMGLLRINDFLYELGKLVGRRVAGGPGQTAVVSSSLIGMVSGAAVANVAITGAFTIPYMKRAGYSAPLAGAIEATASTGGQLMPPVMGAAAFLMAFFVGVPYTDIMIAGLIPAILFYVGVMLSVQFASRAAGIKAPLETPDWSVVRRGIPMFVIPVGVLTGLLLLRFSPSHAAFWAICTVVVLSFFRSGGRPKASEFLEAITEGAIVGAQIGVSLCLVGLISQTLITTGLGGKIAGLVELFSAGNIVIGLLLTMIVSLILGCGVPPVAAYSLVALVAIPTIVKMGVPVMAAHFFCFYFAIISAVTPPVAMGALAASAIARANYFSTAMKAFRLSLAGFIIPFFIVFNPAMMMQSTDLVNGAMSIIAILIILSVGAALLYGVGAIRFSARDWLFGIIAVGASIAYALCRSIFSTEIEFALFLTGVLFAVLLTFSQLRQKREAESSLITE
ncbi:MAG: C4-dicarboxylate ABC transporter [Sneathiella sp.]|jgi:TRAP transporter 4TM/12TM fusion protein|uniref:TRAP transporter permease n=1 Tax=Sneathiella sp. TaxID=1964365 RepID=UPI000C4A7DFC|nr:TRAP transporter fused permease subunit [Sneathiella sp.]MAL80628.1 C4-dicarboxylate ABC transporter [Sneathiella sp.]|tara:strand:+ start:373 stop:2271 length:1899 start_codon:yes stop_codon:yes gene_type:complete